MAGLIITLYRILGNILIWPAVLILGRHPNFRSTILQRLSIKLPSIPAGSEVLWVHAASVGEVKAVEGLIKTIKAGRPELFVCLSSVTVTGRDVALRISEIDMVFPFPFDLAWVMRRYLLRVQPRVLMIVETELWPNMILAAERAGIPVVFVNARMTSRSYHRYEKIRFVIREVLKKVSVFAIAQRDGQRYCGLGAKSVEVLGNLKLDTVGEVDSKKRMSLKKGLGIENTKVFIAGSIREGEESDVLEAIAYAASRTPGLYSIVAPRHTKMLAVLKDMADHKGLKWGLRSAMPAGIDVLFIDTFGELFDLYGVSDVAFVGGSLKDLGGQNILEPISWGIPTIHGPSMDNFSWALEIVQGLTVQIENAVELGPAVTEILMHKDKYDRLAREAQAALYSRRGVVERYIEALRRFM
ncbi:MAG TPA: hypothetical protein ENN05_05885 [Deltaproteobacteria bacterium]|nr:hypothetical protein [Deltaproteobacteria bacterium]